MKQSIVQGYTAIDNCFKYTNSDSTIDCYVFSRQALQKPIKTIDSELKTNSIYLLVGNENDKIKVYVGQAALGADGESVFRRMKQHLDKKAETKERYFPYWTQAIIFVCRNTDPNDMWKTSDIDDLESILIKDTASGYSWNSKNETLRNEISSAITRSHSRKLFDIKEYVKNLGLSFFDEISRHETNNNLSYEDKLAAEEKKLIDKTVNLKTINLEPNARVPEYTTPENIVNSMLDLLPWETFNHNTKFFDPACKGGEFLALIHDRLSLILMNDTYFDKYNGLEKSIRIHDHIIRNQLYVVAIGDNSYKVAKERVYGCENIIKAKADYINGLKDATVTAIKNKGKYIDKELNKEMKFDVIVGNPPYNDTDDTGSSKSINTYFVNLGIQLNAKYMLYIMPDRWFVSPDKLNTNCRESLVGKIKYMRDFDDTDTVFEGTSIRGGVSYFLYDKDFDGEMTYKDNRGTVKVRHNKKFMCKSTQANILYNHVKDKTNQYMDADYISTSFFGLTRNAQGSVIETDDCNIILKSSGDDTYLSIDEIPKNNKYVPLYKVAIPYSAMNPKPFILMPNEICTLTYLIVRFFNNITEAENCKKSKQNSSKHCLMDSKQS